MAARGDGGGRERGRGGARLLAGSGTPPGAAGGGGGARLPLSASASYDPDGRIVSSRWTLGERSVSRSEIVVRFPTPGLLVAVLTVTDARGRESVARVPIEVLPVVPGPILILSAGAHNPREMPARRAAEGG